MNSAVASVLNKVLGDFVENLNADQLNISVFSGSVNLENLRIKQDAIDALGLPFSIKQGTIGRINVDIPWTSLSSSPLKIEVDKVFLHVVSSPTHEWVAKNQDKRLQAAKQSALASYELFNSDELAVVSAPGYLEKLITKVLNNLQISITGVHIRFDDFESSVRPYCIGLTLKSVSAFTCSQAWTKEFIEEGTYTNKLAQIEGLSLFLNDSADLKTTGEPSEFTRQCTREVTSPPAGHQYLIQPSKMTVKIVINKDPRDLTSPQIAAELEDCTLNTRLEMHQLTHFLKLIEFISSYKTFCTGYEASLPVQKLNEMTSALYRDTYKRWKLSVLGGSSSVDEDKARLMQAETAISLNEIIANRKIAQGEISIERVEETKRKEMNEIQSSNKGLMSGIKGFFGSKSKAEKEREENDRQLKVSRVQAELEELAMKKTRLIDEFEDLLASTESFVNLPPDFIRFSIKLNFRMLSFDLADAGHELISYSVQTIRSELGIRQETVCFSLQVATAEIADKVLNSQAYPNLLVVDFVDFKYEEYPDKRLTIRSGNASVIYNLESVLEVAASLQRSVASQFDVSYYAKQASSLVEGYIASGQAYLAKVIQGNYANKSLSIDFEIKAPELIIPFDLSVLGASLVIDLGKLRGSSQKAKMYPGDYMTCEDDAYLYDFYRFDLYDLIVMELNGAHRLTLLNKASVTLTLKNCVITDHPTKPGLVASLQFSDVEAALSDTVITQLVAIQEHSAKLVEAKLPMSTGELTIETRSVDLSHINSFVAFQLDFEVSAIKYSLFRHQECVIKTQLEQLRGHFQSNTAGDFQVSVSLRQLSSADQRPEIYYKDIVYNPLGEDSSQIEVMVSQNRKLDSLTATIKVNDLRLVLCPETVQLLQSFIVPSTSPVAAVIAQGPKKAPVRIALAREVKSELAFSAELKNFELWLPSSATRATSHLVSLSFSSALKVSRTSVMTYKLASDRIIVAREVRQEDIKASIALTRLLLQTGVEDTAKLLYAKHLLPPTDLAVVFSKFLNELEQSQTVTVQTNALHASFGISDLYTLRSIAQGWQQLDRSPAEKPVKLGTVRVGQEGYMFSCSELSCCINDDISKTTLPIAMVKLNDIGLSVWLTRGSEVMFGAELSAFLFNSKLSTWEPFLEPYRPEVWSVQETPRDVKQLRVTATSVLSLNLSYEMMHSLLRLKHRLQKELEWTEAHRTSTFSHQLLYRVANFTGVPVIVWLSLDPASTTRTIEGDGVWEFSDLDLKEMLAQAARSKGIAVPDSVPIYLSLSISQTVCRVPLSETKTFGFNIGQTLIVDMVMANSVKLISIESGVRVMNNTNSPLRIACGPQELSINPRKSIAVPTSWVHSACELHDGVNSYGLNLKRVEAASLLRLSDANVCLDQLCYLVDEGLGEVLVVQLNPSMTVKNCLPGTLKMICEETVVIAEGEETVLRSWSYDETLQVAWELNAKGTDYRGQPAKLPRLDKSTLYAVRGRIVTNELLQLSLTKKLFLQGEDLDLRFKTITRSVAKALEVTASAQFIIVNQTDNSIELSPLNTVVLPHSIGLYATQENAVKLRSVGSSVSSWSPNFNVDTPGVVGTVRVTHSATAAMDLGVSLLEGYGSCVLSKVIQVAPRFVLVNSLDIPIHFSAANLPGATTVPSGGYEAVISSSSVEAKTLQLSDDGQVWSESFNTEEIEDFVFKMRSSAHGAAWYEPKPSNFYHRFVRVTISTRNEATLLITLSNPSSPEFVVSNKTRDLLAVRQGDGPVWEVPPMTDMIYAYDNQHAKTKKVRLSIGRVSRLYSFDKIKRQKPLGSYRVSVIPQLGQKILQVSAGSGTDIEASSGVVEARSEISVILPGICLSVIDESPKEILVLSLQRIAVKGYAETTRLTTDFEEKTGVDVSVGSLQLDNMLTHKQAYPVLFAPSEASMDVPYFQLGIHRIITTSESHRQIERFPMLTILLQETQIRIDYLTVMELSSKLIKLLESSKSNLEESSGELLTTEVNMLLEATTSTRTYFEVLQLGAISLNFSTRVPSNLPESNIKSNLFMHIQRSLLHIANISDSNLQFKSVILMHSFQTVRTLLRILAMNYGRQAVFQFYKVLGSSDLLGNPIGLIDNLGTGVIEFFSEPYKGLIKGPEEFVGGVSKGVKSLVGNVLAGGFGSVSKIAGSLHDIVKEVGGERKMTKKEKKGGILSGVKGGVLDVASGVSGLFSKPMQGAKQSGVTGFFKGMGTGVIGAVSSPVTALLRVGGSVAQSIADSGESIKDTNPMQERGHVRHPRYFGSHKTLETYNAELAEAQFLLKNSSRYANDSIQLLQTYLEATVILTDRNLLFLERGELSAAILISTIQSITVVDTVKVLVLMDRKRVHLTASDEMQAAKLVLAVASLRNMQ
jgi:hypothetical protein